MFAQRLALTDQIYVTQAQAEPIKTPVLMTNHQTGDLLKQKKQKNKTKTKQKSAQHPVK